MLYTSMKHIHLLAIALSVLFLTVRYILMMMDSPLLQKKFFKVTPHVVDTILLTSGISFIFHHRIYSFYRRRGLAN